MTFMDEQKQMRFSDNVENAIATPKEVNQLKDWFARGKRERFNVNILISPGMAHEMLKHNKDNRRLNSLSVARIIREIQKGQFRNTTQGITFAKTGRLLDGQHRLKAIEESGIPTKMLIWFGDDPAHFEFLDLTAGRTPAEIAGMKGLDNTVARASIASVYITTKKGAAYSPSRNEIYQTICNMDAVDPSAMTEALRFGDAMRKQKLVGIGLTPAALAYWKISTETLRSSKLDEFAMKMKTGADLSMNSPILRFRMGVAKLPSTGNYRNLTIKKAAGLILTWNAWLRNPNRAPLRLLDWEASPDLPEVV